MRQRLLVTVLAAVLSCPSIGAAVQEIDVRYAVAASYAMPGSAPPVIEREPPGPFTTRNTRDQADAATDKQTHVVYFVPKGATDHAYDTNGTLSASIKSMLAWFRRETNGMRPRMDLTATGAFDISYVEGSEGPEGYTFLDSMSKVISDVRGAGLNKENKRYLIYAEVNRDHVCGEATYPLWPAAETGQYALVYLDSGPDCGARDFGDGTLASSGRTETIAAHEWLHDEAIAPVASAHYCRTNPYHVCTGALWVAKGMDPEQNDIVFPFITAKIAGMDLDINDDDYWDPDVPGGVNLRDSEWMETV